MCLNSRKKLLKNLQSLHQERKKLPKLFPMIICASMQIMVLSTVTQFCCILYQWLYTIHIKKAYWSDIGIKV